jgi:hypothetical protein
MNSEARLARTVSTALAVMAAVASLLSFVFWQVFHRDVPVTVGNMRGTALTVLVIAVPLLVASMALASRGSLRARFTWLAALAYLAYNSVMFLFGARFNSFFLLFAAMLALSFWSLVALLRTLDPHEIRTASDAVPRRAVAVYLLVSAGAFGVLWLQAIIPATVTNTMPAALVDAGFSQNPVWVIDFAFTFPLMVIGAVWIWQRRAWGFVIAGMMVVMLTVETAGIAIDQAYGHLHDPSAPLDAIPIMLGFTVAGLVFSVLFLRGVRTRAGASV